MEIAMAWYLQLPDDLAPLFVPKKQQVAQLPDDQDEAKELADWRAAALDCVELAAALGRGLADLPVDSAVREAECKKRRDEVREGVMQIQAVLGETESDLEALDVGCQENSCPGGHRRCENIVRAVAAYRGRLCWAAAMCEGLRRGTDALSQWDVPEDYQEYDALKACLAGCSFHIARLGDRMAVVESSARATCDEPPSCTKAHSYLQCPSGHTLTRFKAPTTQFSCDRCGAILPRAGELMGCRHCDYDLCLECAEADAESQFVEVDGSEKMLEVFDGFSMLDLPSRSWDFMSAGVAAISTLLGDETSYMDMEEDLYSTPKTAHPRH